MEDAGAAAITMESLFEEQIDLQAFGPAQLPRADDVHVGRGDELLPEGRRLQPRAGWLPGHIRQAKEAVDVPVIGSLNGVTPGGWTRYARLIEEAGATR